MSELLRKNSNTTVSEITNNLHKAGVKVQYYTPVFHEDFESRNIEATSSSVRIRKPQKIQRWATNILEPR